MQAIFLAARGKANSPDNDPTQKDSGNTKVGVAGILLKNAPGRMLHLHVFNTSATAYVVMLFDKVSAPANGDTPFFRKRLPASGEITISVDELGLFGHVCANGIGFAISTAAAFDTLTLGASDVHFHALYK